MKTTKQCKCSSVADAVFTTREKNACVITNDNGEVLLVQNPLHQITNAGLWNLDSLPIIRNTKFTTDRYSHMEYDGSSFVNWYLLRDPHALCGLESSELQSNRKWISPEELKESITSKPYKYTHRLIDTVEKLLKQEVALCY